MCCKCVCVCVCVCTRTQPQYCGFSTMSQHTESKVCIYLFFFVWNVSKVTAPRVIQFVITHPEYIFFLNFVFEMVNVPRPFCHFHSLKVPTHAKHSIPRNYAKKYYEVIEEQLKKLVFVF